ncbi:Pentatricopeptide repeat-containing protein At4g26680, mitochondrial [Linum perenne]
MQVTIVNRRRFESDSLTIVASSSSDYSPRLQLCKSPTSDYSSLPLRPFSSLSSSSSPTSPRPYAVVPSPSASLTIEHLQVSKPPYSPNVYTLNMVMSALRKSGRLDKAVELFAEMENGGVGPNVASYNVLIAGYCKKGLLSSSMKLKSSMERKKNNGLQQNVVTFNTLIHELCKEGRLQEASKVLSEMKLGNVVPNTVTFNTLMNGYSQGKTKKAAYLVKELDKEKMVPNASTFSALIGGQCARNNPDRASQLYKTMVRSGCHPNKQTFDVLIAAFCKNKDFEGACRVLLEMLNKCITPTSDFIVDTYNGLSHATKKRNHIDDLLFADGHVCASEADKGRLAKN